MARPKKKEVQTSATITELKNKYNLKVASDIKQDPKLKTGVFALDYVLDGGISQCEGGHRIEFYGRESGGKTTFALAIIKRYQELGKKCLYVDAEQSFDTGWAGVLGVDIEKLIVATPEYLEEAGDLMAEAIPKFDLIVIDSIPSLIPRAELEGSLEDRNMALQAQLNSPLTRKLYNAFKGNFTTVIFINQIREKVGGYGNPLVTPGGRALKHLYNTRIEFKPTEFIEEGTKEKKVRIGVVNVLHCTKNKKGKPHRVTAVDFYYDGFIDNKKSLLYSGMKYGIIQQNGPMYIYKDFKAKGKDTFCETLKNGTWKEIEKEIWRHVK